MPKITIVSGIPLCANPRVVKEARVLANAGFEVETLSSVYDLNTARHDDSLTSEDLWKNTRVMDNTSEANSFAWRTQRLKTRLGRESFRRFGVVNRHQLGYAASKLLDHCFTDRADLFVLHLEQALWVGHRLLKTDRNVGIDIEIGIRVINCRPTAHTVQ